MWWALPLLEGQVDWQQEVKRRGELARGSLLALVLVVAHLWLVLALARRRLALVLVVAHLWLVLALVLALVLQPVLALVLVLQPVLALQRVLTPLALQPVLVRVALQLALVQQLVLAPLAQ